MALGNVTFYDEAAFGNVGSEQYRVQLGATTINAGEPVAIQLGTSGTCVTALATNKPLVGTDYMVGIAQSTSTQTASADGIVYVWKMDPNATYLCAPLTAASWDTQAEYNAKVGSRVLFDLTSSTYTITATDSGTVAAWNGLTVEPLDIAKYPGVVRFSINPGVNYKNSSVPLNT